MSFTLKEEELFDRYLAHVVPKEAASDVKQVISELYADVNTNEVSADAAIKKFVPQIIEKVKPADQKDTEKILDEFIRGIH